MRTRTPGFLSSLDALTIHRCLSRENHDNELQPNVSQLQVFEHGLHTVRTLCVFAEARLALDGHPCVLGDLAQLVCKTPTDTKEALKIPGVWQVYYL